MAMFQRTFSRFSQSMKRYFEAYSRALDENPYRTQILTSTVLWSSGDILVQTLESDKRIDWNRVARCTLFGLAVSGPVFCWWYRALESFTSHLRPNKLKYLGSKIILDQLVFEPVFLGVSFVAFASMEKQSWSAIKDQLSRDFAPTFLLDCAVWIPAQLLNFSVIPLKYQSLFVNMLSVIWNGYVSHVSHSRDALPDTRVHFLESISR